MRVWPLPFFFSKAIVEESIIDKQLINGTRNEVALAPFLDGYQRKDSVSVNNF